MSNEQQENTRIILPGEQPAIIKIIGVGGGGVNSVNRMIAANVSNVDFYAVNTDSLSLRQSSAENKIQLGADGLGVGGDPVKAQKYAEENEEMLKDMLIGANMVFVVGGMGGGTGTGAAPIIAKLSKEMGILTVGVVTRPFENEGSLKAQRAKESISKLKEYTDALIVIPNDRIYTVVDQKTPITVAYSILDDVLRISIESITDTITKTGVINIDFADVKDVLTASDYAIIAMGTGNTLKEAFDKALANKFVEGEDITEATKILFNVSCSTNNEVTVGDMNEISNELMSKCRNKLSLKPGFAIDNNLDMKIKVSIIASFQKKEEPVEDLIEYAQKELPASDDTEQEKNVEPEDPFAKPACETYDKKKTKRL